MARINQRDATRWPCRCKGRAPRPFAALSGAADINSGMVKSLTASSMAFAIGSIGSPSTQISPTSYWLRMADELRPVRGVERFVLLYPPGAPTDQSETDLFAGVRL